MTPPRFDQIQPQTPDLDQVRSRQAELEQAYADAADAASRVATLDRWNELRSELDTWASHVRLRFQQDTRDADRKAALERHDEMAPKLNELQIDFLKKLKDGPHADEISDRFGPHLLDLWGCRIASYDPAIEQETIAESKATNAYTQLVASARFEFQGETLNLSQLAKYSQHPDRAIRHEAAKLRWRWFGENAEALDRLYDELVRLRATQAEKLGKSSYVELAYEKLGRTDYDRSDVEGYRKAIREHVVPLCTALRERQRETLGLDSLMAWDEAVHDLSGNPRPNGTHAEKMTQARAMFDEMGPALGQFFRTMDDGGFLDLEAREGKAGGGFCTSFPTIGMPFIFANFNGTKSDVEVFTHEVGHAFQCWSSREQPMLDFLWPTLEAAEVHSMSLEYLTWPQMEKFFGDDADRFRRLHLTESLLFLPYGCAVDAFQHAVYDHPTATPDERLAMWREVEAEYLPWRRWGDLERPAAGGMWQGQGHVYHVPFYYIDYTLASVCALQFWAMAEDDRDAAMSAYVSLCRRGGEAPFQTLVRSAGLESPLESGCLEDIVQRARNFLGA